MSARQSGGFPEPGTAETEALAAAVRTVPPVEPEATVERAVALMWRHQTDMLPVLEGGRLVGLLTEADLPPRVAAASAERVGEWMRPVGVLVAPVTVGEVLEARASSSATVLGVVDENGQYLGLVRLRDVLAQATQSLRPLRVGGMATPFGVHLHNGTAMGGAGHLALVLAGVVIAIAVGLSWVVMYVVSWLIDSVTGWHMSELWVAGWVGPNAWGAGWMVRVQAMGFLLVFLWLLRMSHVSQYHAAEHMVVHALEHGEPLTVEAAARMPRVHARCGSNLVVVIAVIAVALAPGSSLDWRWLLAALLLLPWSRQLGALAQRYFATRPPRAKHLESALQAAQQLLRRYAAGRARRPTLLSRVWYSGLVHVGTGLGLAYGAWHLLERLLLATVMR